MYEVRKEYTRLSPLKQRQAWDKYMQGIKPDVIAKEFGVSSIQHVITKFKKKYGIPKGYKQTRMIQFMERIHKPLLLPDEIAPSNPKRTEIHYMVNGKEIHIHDTKYIADGDFVFCKECGKRWIAEA